MGDPTALELARGINNSTIHTACYEILHRPSLPGFCEHGNETWGSIEDEEFD
jgi:hypothetical protein